MSETTERANQSASASSARLYPHGEESTKVIDILRRWHDETHPFAFQVCQEQPCHAVNQKWSYR